ncbi:DUF2935 domain-containing protein [Paenibacillus sp. P26]|nr:DUF2935 domain-containing protein [Paenibacillus sp. P26]UUZ93838.1 DUF2935 domain-containing protein [Paenibacillus sp. P25]
MEPLMSYPASALFEHRFWLQVLGDHARFIREALSTREQEEVERAKAFVHVMDALLERARSAPEGEALRSLNQEADQRAKELRDFKLHLLRRHLIGTISIGLPPTFLSHMVNELEEYLRVLGYLLSGQPAPVFHDVHHHLVWPQDAYGHAASIASDLDMTEKRLIEMAQTFDQHFRDFYLKAVELAGYLRTNLKQFPALTRFNKEVELEMVLFRQFLHELEELRMGKEALGTLSPLWLTIWPERNAII